MPWQTICCRRNGCPEIKVERNQEGQSTILIRDDHGGVVQLSPIEFLDVYAAVRVELDRLNREPS